jgi:2-polyprenyl-3-methyl-5-hydroxy-6-metoxy-1,4-benzoquinol methylase
MSDNEVTIYTSAHPCGLPFNASFFKYRPDLFSSPVLRPSNPNDVLDQIPEQAYDNDKFLPYWAEQWPSSEIMLNYLKSGTISQKSTIIELGCGLGIISTALALQNHTVIATDISCDALLFTKINSCNNGTKTAPCCVDWRALPFKGRFDVLVASDILYESRWIDPILSCCRQLLHPDGKAIIADPCRRFWPEFKKRAAEEGFKTSLVHTGIVMPQNFTIEILELTLK